MKSWYEYVNETKMTLDAALKAFEVSSLGSIRDLKNDYKKLALKHHPDRGGNVAKMAEINAAYDFLKSVSGVTSTSTQKSKEQDEQENKDKWAKAFLMTKHIIDSQLEIDNFIKHFEGIFNETFTIKKLERKEIETGRYAHNQHYSIRWEIGNKTNEISFHLFLWAHTALLYGKTLLPGDVGDLSASITTEILYNRRKMKLSKSDWSFRTARNLLSDPNILFPRDKIVKKTKTIKKGKFSKKDFTLSLERVLQAKRLRGDEYMIPLGDDKFLSMDRITFLRMGSWQFNGIYKKPGKFTYTNIGEFGFKTLIESEELLNFVIDLVQDLQRTPNPETRVNEIKNRIERFSQNI